MMKRLLLVMIAIFMVSGCRAQEVSEMKNKYGYTQISQEKAKEMMEKDDGHVIVDVRREDEYAEGHIPDAINIPNERISTGMPSQLPDLNQIILVYCRSGNRSKDASEKLARIGYTNVYEFGGINTWTGGIVTEDSFDDAIQPVPVLVIEAGDTVMYASFEDNPSAQEFIERLSVESITVDMHDYGSFEKVGTLPWKIVQSNEEITTVPGDVILYQGEQITIYYDQNTWELTRLAKIGNTSKDKLQEILGEGDVTVSFHIEWSE